MEGTGYSSCDVTVKLDSCRLIHVKEHQLEKLGLEVFHAGVKPGECENESHGLYGSEDVSGAVGQYQELGGRSVWLFCLPCAKQMQKEGNWILVQGKSRIRC